jgi:CcmD family protein
MNDAVRTVLPMLPFVVGAYGLLWVALFGYMVWVNARLGRTEKEVAAVEASVKRREKLDTAERIVAEEKASKA